VGSPDYMPPEMLQGMPYDETVDWWSIGSIIYECLYGITPFQGDTPQEIFCNILDHDNLLQFPTATGQEDANIINEISPEAIDLIKGLLSKSDTRLGKNGIQEIKNHPFFKEIVWDKILQEKPPYVPQLKSEEDTTYFDKKMYEEENSDDEDKTPGSVDISPKKSGSGSQRANQLLLNSSPDLSNSLERFSGFSFRRLSRTLPVNLISKQIAKTKLTPGIPEI